jgi:hypothetical protein
LLTALAGIGIEGEIDGALAVAQFQKLVRVEMGSQRTGDADDPRQGWWVKEFFLRDATARDFARPELSTPVVPLRQESGDRDPANELHG